MMWSMRWRKRNNFELQILNFESILNVLILKIYG